MENFKHRIENILRNKTDKHKGRCSVSDENEPLITLVYDIFETATNLVNDTIESGLMNIMKIPHNLNSILFNYERGSGLLITFGNSKLVMVFFENAESVTFVGKLAGNKDRNIKLLGLEAKQYENGRYQFMDNSGLIVDMEEVALNVINWGFN